VEQRTDRTAGSGFNSSRIRTNTSSAYKRVFWFWSLYWPRPQMCCCTFDTKVTSHRLRFLTGAHVFLLAIFVHTGYQACSAYISGVTSSLSANRTEITYGHSEVKSTYPLYSKDAVLQIGRSLVRSQLVPVNFSLTKSFRSHYGPGVDSASNRNEYQEYFLRVKAAGA